MCAILRVVELPQRLFRHHQRMNDIFLGLLFGLTNSLSDTWINHYISEYNQDSDKMCALFEAIAELGNEDRKITFLRYLISCNDDVELFRRIELLPREVSWSVTTFYGWIKYLEKLRPLFVGLPYLKHRIIVNEEIDRLHAMIERVEIEDVLRG